MNKVRCILQACGMDNRYWGEALRYVVYTENRSPTKALGGKTPFEALFDRKPNIISVRSAALGLRSSTRRSGQSWTPERPSVFSSGMQVNTRVTDWWTANLDNSFMRSTRTDKCMMHCVHILQQHQLCQCA
ncbi:Aste57867_4319 [Aphanomyces stellatus]|uniref:Aste57867_4319 protein n=1 Tax=Aphanomyces stellatus TaxID=120398 RepID=A0A485KCJ8_9STRA|nr:hypothetical protein As57867_004308 [Aphanomyces stellatus]VFT81433.1 Aste57867_4319 [Aphanomyces stellatus]